MYTVITQIYEADVLLDSYHSTFVVRDIRFTADNGFYLNDKRVQLKGVNLHHDHGSLGAAFNTRAMERRLEIMKNMGCNAVRTSHNTPAPELLDLCDKMGLLVFNEIFDKYDPTRPTTLACDSEKSAAMRHSDYYDVHSEFFQVRFNKSFFWKSNDRSILRIKCR